MKTVPTIAGADCRGSMTWMMLSHPPRSVLRRQENFPAALFYKSTESNVQIRD